MRVPALAVLCTALLFGCAGEAPDSVLDLDARYSESMPLPPPRLAGPASLEEALANRRSTRSFADELVPMETVAQLLWSGQGVTDDAGHRTAPSAGARYPIELYAVSQERVMHYLPAGHAVELRSDSGALERLADSSFGQEFVGTAPLLLVIVGVVERTEVEYGAVADDLMQREAGHVAQNILLQATASGLAAVPVGGFDPAGAARALLLPAGEEVLYIVPVGHR